MKLTRGAKLACGLISLLGMLWTAPPAGAGESPAPAASGTVILGNESNKSEQNILDIRRGGVRLGA